MRQPLPIKPPGSRFTDSQWQSIHDGGENLLVSASAGSGKTTVLVERVIEKIKAGVSIDELLVVTYTNAAAREMKERIQTAIQKSINNEPESDQRRHLVRQLPLLGHADISTLHSFCLKVIRRFYYLIDLDPVFRLLADETEVLLIKEEVWDEVREELYGEEGTLFKKLAATYSNDRNDDRLSEMIFSLHEFSRANPDPDRWLDSLASLYQVKDNTLASSPLYEKLIRPQLLQILDTCIELVDTAHKMGEGEEELDKLNKLLEEERTAYQSIRDAVSHNQLESAHRQIQAMAFARWSAPRKKTTPEEVKEAAKEMKVFRDKARDGHKRLLQEYFLVSPQQQVDMMGEVGELVQEMARVTKRFTQAYQDYKQSRKLLDFNDLEHYTLRILAINEDGRWHASEASDFYRRQFNEVMVDEYQDINRLQEQILRWLTQPQDDKGNLFMVGDVKQSIYAFRLADPGLFLEKYARYAEGDGGQRIVLSENFRSRKEVLDFTNLIFRQLMDKEVGQLAYDEAAKLVLGFQNFPDEPGYETEVLIFEKEEEDTEENEEELSSDFQIDSKTKGELTMTAEKILELRQNGFQVYDKKADEKRPIKYSDIVLLTPTKKNNLAIQDIFSQLGIPTSVKDTQNYFQTTEVTIVMSLLKVIDNPHQDIPLAAVLRSPIVGLDENDLAAIRIANKTSDFYDALITYWRGYSKTESTIVREQRLFNKVDHFLQQLERWREQARRMRLVDLIWLIYRETGIMEYVSGMSSGKQRKANLHALYERAANYEKTTFKGLFQFIRFIERMQKKDKDLAEPAGMAEWEDAVRVMTIHASKGLEFPVVFVMDMSKQFNQQNLRQPYILDENYGVGAEYKNLDKRLSVPTLPQQALKTEKKNKLLSEEMRVLYVALTRAEQKLFLVGSYKNQDEAWQRWGLVSGHQPTILPGDLRLNARSMMDWIGMSLVRHPDSGQTQFPDSHNSEVKNHAARFSIHFITKKEVEETAIKLRSLEGEEWYEEFRTKQTPLKTNQETIDAVKKAIEKMNIQYTYQAATQTTSYQSVSEIKRLFEDPDENNLVKLDVTTPRGQNRYVQDELERPSFISELTVPTPAEIGMAAHLILQSLDLSEKPNSASLDALVQQMVEEGTLKEDVASRVDKDKLLRFFNTDLAERIIQNVQSVQREVPFSLMMNASLIFEGMEAEGDDKILIHGIVDGYIEEEDGLVLFDYKTDRMERFGERAAEVMLDKYRGQVNLYRAALENILAKPVKESYLVLLDTTQIVPVQ